MLHFELQQSKKVLFTSINSLRNIALSSFVDLLQSESSFSQPGFIHLFTTVRRRAGVSQLCQPSQKCCPRPSPRSILSFYFSICSRFCLFIYPSVPAAQQIPSHAGGFVGFSTTWGIRSCMRPFALEPHCHASSA